MAHQARKSNVFYSEQAYKKVVFHRVLYGFVDSSPNVFYSKTAIPKKIAFQGLYFSDLDFSIF